MPQMASAFVYKMEWRWKCSDTPRKFVVQLEAETDLSDT